MNNNHPQSVKKQVGAAAEVIKKKKSRDSSFKSFKKVNRNTSDQPKLEDFMSMSQGPHVKLQQKLKSACREPKSPKSHRNDSRRKLGTINPETSEIKNCEKIEKKFCPSDYISSDSISDAASS